MKIKCICGRQFATIEELNEHVVILAKLGGLSHPDHRPTPATVKRLQAEDRKRQAEALDKLFRLNR